jgi:hypothetical protein
MSTGVGTNTTYGDPQRTRSALTACSIRPGSTLRSHLLARQHLLAGRCCCFYLQRAVMTRMPQAKELTSWPPCMLYKPVSSM